MFNFEGMLKAPDVPTASTAQVISNLQAELAEATKAMEFNFEQYQDAARLMNEECEKNEALQRENAQLKAALAAQAEAMQKQLDGLLVALKAAKERIAIDRESLFDCHKNIATGEVDDELGLRGLSEYDEVLSVIEAATGTKITHTIQCAAACGTSVPVMAKDEGEDHLCHHCGRDAE